MGSDLKVGGGVSIKPAGTVEDHGGVQTPAQQTPTRGPRDAAGGARADGPPAR
jgi:hypothetical protein